MLRFLRQQLDLTNDGEISRLEFGARVSSVLPHPSHATHDRYSALSITFVVCFLLTLSCLFPPLSFPVETRPANGIFGSALTNMDKGG